jgi:hypothetical protein
MRSADPRVRLRPEIAPYFHNDDFDVVPLMHGLRLLLAIGATSPFRLHFLALSDRDAVLVSSKAPISHVEKVIWQGPTKEVSLVEATYFWRVQFLGVSRTFYVGRGLGPTSSQREILERRLRSAR